MDTLREEAQRKLLEARHFLFPAPQAVGKASQGQMLCIYIELVTCVNLASYMGCAPFHFCVNCGSYSKDRVDALSRPCRNSATAVHFVRATKRLFEGRHPVTEQWLARVYPVSRISFCRLDEVHMECDELEVVNWPEEAANGAS